MTTAQLDLRATIDAAVRETPILDIHTHIYAPAFGPLLLWGIDELLTYHYLVAETLRYINLPYDAFWAMPKRAQADLIWRTLFLEHSPVSEACRGVLTVLEALGLDTASRDLAAYRRAFAAMTVEEYTDRVFTLANVSAVIMTNDPFDDLERPVWESGFRPDPRFQAALRLDSVLNTWAAAVPRLRGWGYAVDEVMSPTTLAEVRRFLADWITHLDARYLAVSLPPTFRMPEDSTRGRLIADAVLPVCAEHGKPFAMMIGVKKLINPDLRLAGDGVGKGDIDTVEYLCATYPQNKFLVTMLARENQHELCVAARKFRNLHPFGCWWFLNNPTTINEMTRIRLELLGFSMTPQHSDARVLDQLLYKWVHSRALIADILYDKYADLAATGWQVTEAEIRRDVADLFGGSFQRFLINN
jgi:hypothetical protein